MENGFGTYSGNARLIVDPPASGAWNMAVDEALLEQAGKEGCVTLRFYEWEEPTLSLGYFQSHTERQSHASSADCPLVRRQSGGGAILHDCELTYSLIVPPGHKLARNAGGLYRTVHEAIIAEINGSSGEWIPELWRGCRSEAKQPEPFLCFQRRSPGDVVLCGRGGHHKVVGSAQRRRRGAILQHGSILIDRSRSAPELPGVNDLIRSKLSSESLRDRLCETLLPQLQLGEKSPARAIESATICKPLAERLINTKHASQDWLLRR